MLSYYVVLGIKPSATPAEIKGGYWKQARESHPDRDGTAAHFQTVRQAYETLSDPERRQQYDARRAEWLRQLGAVDCPSCAKPNRVKPGRRALCGECKTELPTRPASPIRERAAEMALDLGERFGEQVSALVVDGLEIGFSRLRQRLGIPAQAAPSSKPSRRS